MSALGRIAGLGGLAALGWAAWRTARRGDALRGRVVLITGGSRGLGLILARRFGAEGSRVAICARDERELDGARADLAARGVEALALPCDLRRPEDVRDLVGAVEARLGPVEVLVNNAGIIQMGTLEALGRADFEAAMRTNFHGALHATRAVLPGMRERGRGRIVNITSIGGTVPVPHLLPYCCSKFALFGFSQGLRTELAGSGIRVTTVVPGLMRTGSFPNAWFKGRVEGEFAWFALASSLPLTAMSAERAARRIVRATRRGEGFVTLGWQARLLRLAHALFPAAVTAAWGWAGAMLPPAPEGADGERLEEDEPEGEGAVRGMKLAHPLAPSPLTALANRAARRNNEYGGRPRPAPDHARKAGLDAERG